MPEVLDPEQLPETQPDGLDPNRNLLDNMGYQNPDESELSQPAPTIDDRIRDARDTVDQARGHVNKSQDWLKDRAEKKAAKQGLHKNEREVVNKALGKKMATRAEGEAAKAVARKATVKVGTSAVAKIAAGSVVPVIGNIAMAIVTGLQLLWPAIKKYWPRVVLIISFIFLLPAMAFGLLGGKGANIPAGTSAQFGQATLVAAIGGDFVLSGRKITEAALKAEKARYRLVLSNAKVTNPELVARIEKDSQEIFTLIEQGINLSGEAKKKQTNTVIAKVQALDSTLPFGTWIANAAKGQVGKGSQNFCKVTGAGSKVACASFVSTVLQNAGVPSPIRATTTAVWLNPALQTVINRLDNSNAGLFNQSKDLLRPGDIIWWGDGTCSSVAYAGKEFDHIGFYIGNGMAIDNSSKSASIKERQAAKRDSDCRFFNGAKRYGKSS